MLYNEVYAGVYPNATFDQYKGETRCILTPMRPTDATDPEGQQTSLQIRYSYRSANEKYYIFFVCYEVKDRAADDFSHSEYVRFAIYPVDGNGRAQVEPTDVANYGSQEALEAAQREFWDMVNG